MKVVGNVLAGVLSVVYFVVLFVMMILLFVSNVFKANYYESILKDIDLADIKLADFGISISEFGSDASVEDVLVQALEEVGFSKNEALKVVNNEKINEVVGEFFSDTVDYLINNEEVPQLDYQEALDIMKSDEITAVLEEAPTEEEIKEFVDELNKYISESFEGGI